MSQVELLRSRGGAVEEILKEWDALRYTGLASWSELERTSDYRDRVWDGLSGNK